MSVLLPATDTTLSSRTERRCLIALLVLAALLRLGVICWKPESLAEDRDLYWGIAKRVAAGHGFANPDWGYRTAYRPPLYPLLLAGIIVVGGGTKLLATVQIGLSVATVWLTWRLAYKLGLKSNALLAAAFVALNPLLIQSTTLAMTETLCAFLVAAWLVVVVETRPGEWQRRWGIGVLFGLIALCRPTVWAFAGLASVVCTLNLFRRSPIEHRHEWGKTAFDWSFIVLTCGLTIAPWAIRNYGVFMEPIVTTTHGGYTLLLGNNDEVYRDEIAEPTGQPWDSREWQKSLEPGRVGEQSWKRLELWHNDGKRHELLRDRWMSARARVWIRQHPREFAELCVLRVRRFWNIFPGGADAGSLPKIAQWGMAVFFGIELAAAAVGLWRLRRDEWSQWWPLVLLVLSFALVHVVYWSNLRMRAPVEPVLALLAARGLTRSRSAFPG
ncbi:MAG: glycosyltransferase family 39 protein [Planctomycetaceae bacterium]|nr:glycosyltransferase family 39 protein [Planctomycetaceae bacterium]